MSTLEQKRIIVRLEGHGATVKEICRIAGVAGASIGVIHGGNVVFKAHYGAQDLSTGKQADGDTLYGIGSCSKSFFTAAAAALVAEKRLDWNEPIISYVPEMRTSCEVITNHASVVDVAAHRMGLSGAFNLAFQGNGEHLIDRENFWEYLPKLKEVVPFRTRGLYNSHGYSMLGEVLERITGRDLNACIQDYITKPLMLHRTFLRPDFEKTANFAKPYSALADGSLFPLLQRQDFRNHFFEAAAGIYTSLNDLLTYSMHMLEEVSPKHGESEPMVKESEMLFSAHAHMATESPIDISYALGWIRTQLPGTVGAIGDNARIKPIAGLPILGRGGHSRLALYHQGATVGYFTSLYLFPETKSAVIVLTNSIANCDAADFIAQATIQELFNDQAPLNWVALTQDFSNRCLQYYIDMQDEIEKKRDSGGPSRDLDQYHGEYFDSTGLFMIKILPSADRRDELQLAFQGRDSQVYDLRYFYDETFEWTLSRDETAKRGRYHQFNQDYFNFHFECSKDDLVDTVKWHHDQNTAEGEKFFKRAM